MSVVEEFQLWAMEQARQTEYPQRFRRDSSPRNRRHGPGDKGTALPPEQDEYDGARRFLGVDHGETLAAYVKLEEEAS